MTTTVEWLANRFDDFVAACEDSVNVERQIASELKLATDILSGIAADLGRLVDHLLDAPDPEERTFE